MNWIDCFLNRLWTVWLPAVGTAFLFAAGFLAVMALVCLTATITWWACFSAALIAAGVFLGLFAAVFLLYQAVACLGAFGRGAGIVAVGPGIVANALESPTPVDCTSAQALLQASTEQLNDAVAARDAQASAVAQAQTALTQAQAALIATLTAVAVSIWNPSLLIGAIAASIAAAALVATRTSALAQESALLAQKEAEVAMAMVDKAAAEALVLQLCDSDEVGNTSEVLGGQIPEFGFGTT
ncbi:MAG: hypothetical protein ACN4GR_08825 [Arenicellales bacterium]